MYISLEIINTSFQILKKKYIYIEKERGGKISSDYQQKYSNIINKCIYI